MAIGLARLLRRENGQDLAEYCLLTALVALIAAAILFQVSGGMENLWTVASHSIGAGGAAAASGAKAAGSGDMSSHQ